MDGVSRNGREVPCPLCEGQGQLRLSDLLDRLKDKELAAKLSACADKIQQESAEKAQAVAQAAEGVRQPGEFAKEVHTWPNKRFLWRRSPKE